MNVVAKNNYMDVERERERERERELWILNTIPTNGE